MLIPIEESDSTLLENYLASRKLKPFDGSYWFAKPILINDKLVTGLVTIITNITKSKIVKIDNRTKEGWQIIYSDPDNIAIYGINNLSDKINKVIVTESILDSESFNQYTKLSDVYSIAFSRASFTLVQFHYLMYLSFYFNFEIYLAFDNDEAGKKATERFIKKAERDYNQKVGIISYPYKDFNDFLCKRENQFKMFVSNKLLLFKGGLR